MPVSPDIQALIAGGLDEVRQSPKFILSTESRHILYRALCPETGTDVNFAFFEKYLRRANETGLPQGFRRYVWLLVLTAQYAQPVLEQYVARIPHLPASAGVLSCAALPATILNTTKQLLRNEIGFDEASDLMCHDFYDQLAGVDFAFTYPVFCAVKAPYDALRMILYGYDAGADVAQVAVEACAAIDENAPGVWVQNYFPIEGINPELYSAYFLDEETIADRKTGYPSIYHPPIPIRYELNKRLQFWEWWLIEAIPQAWALGDV